MREAQCSGADLRLGGEAPDPASRGAVGRTVPGRHLGIRTAETARDTTWTYLGDVRSELSCATTPPDVRRDDGDMYPYDGHT